VETNESYLVDVVLSLTLTNCRWLLFLSAMFVLNEKGRRVVICGFCLRE
jgi:hypothetical protein